MRIYADALFAVNFFMDYFILWLTSRLWRYKPRRFAVFRGALLMAGGYTLIACVPQLYRTLGPLGQHMCLIAGLISAFLPKSPSELFKLVLIAEASAFVTGGAASALYFFASYGGGSMVRVTAERFSFKLLLIAASGIYIAVKASEGFIKANIVHRDMYCALEFHYNGRSAAATALVDTGNSLRDPISGSGVIIVQYSAVCSLFDEKTGEIIKNASASEALELLTGLDESEMKSRIRLIPFKSLGRENGMLVGFCCPRVKIMPADGSVGVLENAVVGVYNGALSGKSSYDALIGSISIKGENCI